MTVIAYDGKKLITDSACSGGDMYFGVVESKIHKLRDGSLLAAAGSVEDIQLAIRWLNKNDEEYPLPEIQEFEGLRIYKDGTHKMLAEKLIEFDSPLPVFIGSGTPYAYGAYHASKDVLKAVEATCECCLSCAAPIRIMDIAD